MPEPPPDDPVAAAVAPSQVDAAAPAVAELADGPLAPVDDPDVPEALRRVLASGVRPEEIRLDARGRWLYRGGPVAHPRVVALFHRSLQRTPGGTWLLQVGRYAHPVVVEDTGRFVFRLVTHQGALRLLLSDGTSAPFDPAAVVSDGHTFFATPVHDGRELARFVDQAVLALADLLEERDGVPGVRTEDGWWPLRQRAVPTARGDAPT